MRSTASSTNRPDPLVIDSEVSARMNEALLRSLKIDRLVERGSTRKTSRRAVVVLLSILTIFAGLLAWTFTRTKVADNLPSEDLSNVSRVAEKPNGAPIAKSGNVPAQTGMLSASGYVVARRKSTVGSEISGKIAEVLVDEGDFVEKGGVIARLDDVLAKFDFQLSQSRVASSEAAAAAIAADLADARRIYERTESLVQRGAATEADRTKNRARLEVLDAQSKQALAAAETARVDSMRSAAVVEKSTIRAPISGIIVERNAEPGEMISSASAGGFTRTGIVTMASRASIEFEVDVNQAFLKQVWIGQAADATLDSYPDDKIPSHVKEISPAASREKGTVKIRIAPDTPDARILPDMAVSVVFKTKGVSEATRTHGGEK